MPQIYLFEDSQITVPSFHGHTQIDFDIQITLVKRVEQEQQRLATENWWINKLNTFLPHGLNTRTGLYNVSN